MLPYQPAVLHSVVHTTNAHPPAFRPRSCASNQGSDGKWNKFGGRLAWDASAICSNNPAFGGRGNPKQGDDYAAAPNIDHTQERIRNVRLPAGGVVLGGLRLD